jgi:hypothetical protein
MVAKPAEVRSQKPTKNAIADRSLGQDTLRVVKLSSLPLPHHAAQTLAEKQKSGKGLLSLRRMTESRQFVAPPGLRCDRSHGY